MAAILRAAALEALPPGNLAAGADGFTVTPQGGTIVVGPKSTGGQQVTLMRTTNSGNTSLAENFSSPLKGIITSDSSIMRDDSNGGAANFFGAPYVRGSNGTNALSIGFSKGTISAYSGTTSQNVQTYSSGRWYQLREVVNTVTQTYDLYIDGNRVLHVAASAPRWTASRRSTTTRTRPTSGAVISTI